MTKESGLFSAINYSHVITPDVSRYPMCHGAYLEQIAPEEIVVSWFAGTREWSADVHLLHTSFDAGEEAWSPIEPLVTEVGYSLGNSIVAKGPDGRLHLWYVRTKHLWQDGEVVYMSSNGPKPDFGDKQLVPLPECWLIRGRPIIRGNTCYLPVYHEIDNISAIWESYLGEPEGKLRETVGAEGGLIHPVIIGIADKEFRAFFRNPWGPNQIHYAYSMNRGTTWSKAHPTTLPNPNSGIDVVALENDIFLCVYNDSAKNRSPLSLALSKNRGMSWAKVGDLERLPEEFSYPSLLKSPAGLFLAYTYRRKAIKFVSLDPAKLTQLADELC